VSRPTWIFDLDNTLHDASPHIFPRMNRAMTEYVMRHAGLDEEAANELRRSYWRRYGATLSGLVRHHGTDPHHFLAETHRFPDLPALVRPEPGLRASLARLPGRKLVFSNSPLHYARAVLGALGVAGLFDAVFTIEHTGFRPKPDVRGFRELMRSHRLVGRRCIMVEDATENLRTAKRLGMTTVLITGRGRTVTAGAAAPRGAHVDYTVQTVRELVQALSHLHRRPG
jgi:putative hydrolase of the HAD superfamily